MNLREKILAEHSRRQCDEIVAWVGDDQNRFDELFGLFLTDEYRVVQRSAWPVSYCVHAHPKFITKHYKALIRKLQEADQPGAVKRNGMRLLQHVNILLEFSGLIMDCCFKLISSPGEAVAIKAFSLTVLGNLAKKYPGIIPEILLIIEDRVPNEKPAFISRAKKLMKDLNWKINGETDQALSLQEDMAATIRDLFITDHDKIVPPFRNNRAIIIFSLCKIPGRSTAGSDLL